MSFPQGSNSGLSFRQTWRRAKEIKKATGRGILSQLRELRKLKRAIGLTGREYYLYNLCRKETPRAEKEQYLTRKLFETRFAILNPADYEALIADKYVAKHFFAAHGLRVPKHYGHFHPRFGRTAGGNELRSGIDLRQLLSDIPPKGLVVKPVRGGYGLGVLVYGSQMTRNPNMLTHVNGEKIPFERFFALVNLQNPLAHPGYLLEERIEQHPFLARYSPATLSTIRVVTLLADDGSMNVLGAFLQMGQDNSGVNTSVDRQLVASIDLGPGKLGAGVLREGTTVKRLTHHPVTQTPIEGETLPEWPAIKQLALKAAGAAWGLRTIGWDIGLAPDGPVLIEGNTHWGEDLLQLALGKGIWTPRIRELVGGAKK